MIFAFEFKTLFSSTNGKLRDYQGVNEDIIRSDLRFNDAEGTACLLNEAIFEGLACMGAKTNAWNEFSSTMASTIICLVDNQKFNFSKYIFDNMVKSLEEGIKFYLFLRFLQVFLDNQVKGMARYKEMYVISSHTKKIFANMRRIRAGFSVVVTPLFETMMVQDATDMGDTPVETHQTPIDGDHVPTLSSDPLPCGEDSYTLNELMVFYTNLKEHVFDLQEAKDAQSKEIVALKKKVFKLLKWRKSRSGGLRRLMKIGSGRRVKSPLEKDSLGAQEDASKQGRMIEEIDQDDKISLDVDTHGRKNDDEMFGVDNLSKEKVVLDTTTGEHEEQIIEDVSTAKPVNTAGEVVTTIADKVSVAPTTDVTKYEITMAQALAALKSIKPKVVIHEQEVSTTIPAAATTITTVVPTPRAKGIVFHEQKKSHIPTVSSLKDKGKAKMIAPKVPIKKKDQMRMDEEYAKRLKAKEQEAARLSRAQQDEEDNISWDNTQAMMEADSLLAERLQAREKEELSVEQKARLLVELIEKRKKHFAALRTQEKRNKPPTKAQIRSQICTYLRNMGGYKHSHLNDRSYNEIKKLFDKEMKKKQKVDNNVDPVIDDTEELKKCMEIVPDDGDEVLIEATPISSRSPTIIDYKIHKEGKNYYFKIIRAYDSQMHNNIMAAGFRDRPPMLAPGRYPQWRSRRLRYVDTRRNGEALRKCILSGPYKPTTVLDMLSSAPSPKPSIPSRSKTTTKHKGKEIAKSITPPSETASEEDSDPEQAQRHKDMQKNLALIAKYFKKIYKPTNNNLRTSSNSNNKNVDTTPRYKNDDHSGQFGTQRTVNVAGTREKECRKPKRVKDSAYHKEKMLLCKQAEQGVPFQAKQYDWLADTDEKVDEQELEAHHSYITKIQEVPNADSGTNSELVEQNDQNNVESDDERVALENSKSLGESISVRDSCLVALQTKQTEFEKFKAFNDRTINYDKFKRKLNEALGQLAHKDTVIREGLKTKAYELLVVKEKHDELKKQSLLTKSYYEGLVKQKTKAQSEIPCLYAYPYDQNSHANRLILDGEETLALERESRSKLNKDSGDSLKFVHKLIQEMHAVLKYVESLEKAIDKLESEKAEFSDLYDMILHNYVSKDVMCSYLQSLFDLDALAELQRMYLHKVKECDCLAKRLSKQTDSVSKKVDTKLLQHFAKVEKHLISLEIALQNCKVQVKNDTVCNEKASNRFRKELEQHIKIQDLKANYTKFDRPSVVRQPNAQQIPKPSVLGKPTPFSNSLDRIYFQKTESVPKANVSEGVNHNTNVSRLQLKSNQSKDKVLPNNGQVKAKKTQVEVHPRIPSVFNKKKSVTACKDSLNSRTLNVNDVCATCNKCLVDSNHFACVTKMLNDVHARTKKPNHMTGNLKLLCNFIEKFLGNVRFGNDQFVPILGYGDLVQGNVMINRVYYVEGLNHNLFSVGQFCDADLEVAFRKSTCFVRDLQGNDLLATPTQAWLWHRILSHLNFDYINLLSKKYVMIGLPKLKYVKDQLCSSCELSKAKRSSFKSKVVLSFKGRLNLLQMDLCGPMRVASINGKKYIMVIVDDYSRDGENLDKMKEKGDQCILVGYSTQSKGYRVYNKRTRMIVESIYVSDYDDPNPVPKRQDVYSLVDEDVPSQQELDMLFGPLYDEFFNAGSNPSMNVQSTSAPSTHTNVHAEENNNDQAKEGEHVPYDEFTNPFCALTQEVTESSSHNIGNSDVPTFNQP
nr:hypothetical protein [Tanacetum cinerariifolium]